MPTRAKTSRRVGFVVRRATGADSKSLGELVVGLAEFERLDPPDSRAKIRLVRDIFKRRLARVFVASIGRKLVGYALYFYTYSSFLARPTLYLEDIFVRPESRREGVGEALFMKCVKEAKLNGCGRMEWQVLTWNRKAIEFYEKLGAKRLDDLCIYRLNQKSIYRLAKQIFCAL